MTWPQYRHIVTQIKTAIRSNLNPTAIINGERPRAKPDWTLFDLKLLEAYEMLEEVTCPYCGQPRWICEAREGMEWFDFTTGTGFCKGKMAKDLWEESEKKAREKDKSLLKPGEFMTLEPKVDGGFLYKDKTKDDRPDRESWLKHLNDQAL